MKLTRDQLVGLDPVRPTPIDSSGTVDREEATIKNLGASVRALQET